MEKEKKKKREKKRTAIKTVTDSTRRQLLSRAVVIILKYISGEQVFREQKILSQRRLFSADFKSSLPLYLSTPESTLAHQFQRRTKGLRFLGQKS